MARILIVDDEPFVRALVTAFLKETDHALFEAGDGQEGLARARTDPPDVVITDNSMPNMTGVEMVPILRREFPDTRIIAMSGFGLEDVVQAGAHATLPKPFTKAELLQRLQQVLAA